MIQWLIELKPGEEKEIYFLYRGLSRRPNPLRTLKRKTLWKKESVIQSVVCRNQAQITRQAVLEVKEGIGSQGIPPQADADSFR